MGLLDFFRRRRSRESALPPGYSISSDPSVVGSTTDDPGAVAGVGAQLSDISGSSVPIDDAGDPGRIGELIGDAIERGEVEVTRGENQVIDLRGTGLREEILEAMKQHGVGAEGGSGETIDAGSVPGLQEAIMRALADHGVDLDQLSGDQPAGESDFGGASGGGDSGDSGSDSGSGDVGGGDAAGSGSD